MSTTYALATVFWCRLLSEEGLRTEYLLLLRFLVLVNVAIASQCHSEGVDVVLRRFANLRATRVPGRVASVRAGVRSEIDSCDGFVE